MDVPAFVQTDEHGLVRDTHNHALLVTDRAALDRHRAQRVKSRTLLDRLDTLEREVIALRHWQAVMQKRTAPWCTCSNCTHK